MWTRILRSQHALVPFALALVACSTTLAGPLEDGIATATFDAQHGRYESAIATLTAQLVPGLDRDDQVRVLGTLGDIELSAGHPDEALSHYQEILALDPMFGRAYFMKGLVLKSKPATLAAAIDSFETAIKNGYSESTAFSNLGFCYKTAVDMELVDQTRREEYLRKAEADLSRAIQLDPSNESARGNLADLLYNRGRYEESIAEYEKLHAADPKSFAASVRLGDAYVAAGHTAEAIDLLRQVERGYVPPEPSVPAKVFFASVDSGTAMYLSLATALLKQGRTEDAATALHKLLAISECPGCTYQSKQSTANRRKAQELLERLGTSSGEGKRIN